MKFGYIFLVLLLGACTKYVPGPKGDPGVPGGNGNSNAFASPAITVLPASWDSVDVITRLEWQHAMAVPQLDDNTVKSGQVQVYVQVGESWFALPYYEKMLVTQFSAAVGQIKLYQSHVHGQVPPRPPLRKYRYVLVSAKL